MILCDGFGRAKDAYWCILSGGGRSTTTNPPPLFCVVDKCILANGTRENRVDLLVEYGDENLYFRTVKENFIYEVVWKKFFLASFMVVFIYLFRSTSVLHLMEYLNTGCSKGLKAPYLIESEAEHDGKVVFFPRVIVSDLGQ